MNATAHKPLASKPATRLEAPRRNRDQVPCGRYTLVVQTHPQAENWASSNLQRAGYDVYLPTLIVQRRDPHTPSLLHRVTRPLFSGYLFVHLGNTDPWSPIRYSSGVRQVLMSGSTPHHLPEATRIALQAGDELRRLPLPDSVLYRPGAPVKCLYGPFKNQEAVVISVATNTARVAMPMLGALREITMPLEQLAVRD